MSDCFDHEYDAYEAALEQGFMPTGRHVDNKPTQPHANWVGPFWTCDNCGRRHPPKHKKCFWCKPTTVTTGFK